MISTTTFYKSERPLFSVVSGGCRDGIDYRNVEAVDVLLKKMRRRHEAVPSLLLERLILGGPRRQSDKPADSGPDNPKKAAHIIILSFLPEEKKDRRPVWGVPRILCP